MNADFNTLSIRAQNALKRCGFTDTVKAYCGDYSLLYRRLIASNCGRKTYDEIIEFINSNLYSIL
jgi:hypothetical protein